MILIFPFVYHLTKQRFLCSMWGKNTILFLAVPWKKRKRQCSPVLADLLLSWDPICCTLLLLQHG